MGDDEERVAVKTLVPRWQKDEWVEHAEQLDMSQSEFVRLMVQAGRRGFDLGRPRNPDEPGEHDATPRGDGLEESILELLREEGPHEWDGLVARLSGNFEERLGDALDVLQKKYKVTHSGRDGGYKRVENDED